MKSLNIVPIPVEVVTQLPNPDTSDIEAILKEKIETTNIKIQQLMKEQAERVEKAKREYVAQHGHQPGDMTSHEESKRGDGTGAVMVSQARES